MGCGCGKKGNRAKSVPTKKSTPRKSRRQILKELWDKSKQENKNTKVTRINNKR